ncbi:S-adenosyl-L-methionine-dependent methyltransferase [Tribonema minus]|uniref:S-adenosyl-L-methionine-dependent methyltransferase n=1 Tax=Tribonema minus TaxID=303371 RepID=A0A836CDV1_9STRA|nr:S-adenosyl-L-methionine-dependent methyltransferase [Tribonema minus]
MRLQALAVLCLLVETLAFVPASRSAQGCASSRRIASRSRPPAHAIASTSVQDPLGSSTDDSASSRSTGSSSTSARSKSKVATTSVRSKADTLASGWSDSVVSAVVSSPLFPVLLKGARSRIKSQVARLGVQWDETVQERLAAVDWQQEVDRVVATRPDLRIPEYYLRKFHAYADGNLCLEAALEQDLAAIAVGLHSFPEDGLQAERRLRDAYSACLHTLGASAVPAGALLLDLGCGTGISTVDLAAAYPHAARVVGVDLSPHMIAVGQHLLPARDARLQPQVELRYGDAAEPLLPAESAALVSIGLVLHELPDGARRDIFAQALRVLKPGGALCMLDMDPEGPDSRRVRSNVVAYSILKSTEPYLDQYFAAAPALRQELTECGFAVVREAAVSPRLKAVVAIKAGTTDLRTASR